MVGCNIIAYSTAIWLRWYIDEILNSQKTPHISPWWARYGVSVVSIFEGINCVKMGLHYMLPTQGSRHSYLLILVAYISSELRNEKEWSKIYDFAPNSLVHEGLKFLWWQLPPCVTKVWSLVLCGCYVSTVISFKPSLFPGRILGNAGNFQLTHRLSFVLRAIHRHVWLVEHKRLTGALPGQIVWYPLKAMIPPSVRWRRHVPYGCGTFHASLPMLMDDPPLLNHMKRETHIPECCTVRLIRPISVTDTVPFCRKFFMVGGVK